MKLNVENSTAISNFETLKMKALEHTLIFEKEIFIERSCTSKKQSIGVSKSEMTIWVDSIGDQCATIEWVYNIGRDSEDSIGIGVWFEKNRLVDYDGVFELPKQAIKVLNMNGFVVPKDFRCA